MDSEGCSGWNQIIGCAVAWVTIARDSESEYPFHPVGQFYRVRAGHLQLFVTIVFLITLQFLLTDATEQM